MSYDDYDQDAAEARFDDEMAQLERIAELESLVRDMYGVIEIRNTWWDGLHHDTDRFKERLTALGLLEGED